MNKMCLQVEKLQFDIYRNFETRVNEKPNKKCLLSTRGQKAFSDPLETKEMSVRSL